MIFVDKVKITKEYMQKYRMTLQEFADAIGYKRSSVNNYFSKLVKSSESRDIFWKVVSAYIGIDFEKVEPKEDVKINLPSYIAVTLNSQGRTVIAGSLVKQYEESKIIQCLDEQGLHCKLNVINSNDDLTYILELVNQV